MRIFGFLLIFYTKINTNSAKICLLFRRKEMWYCSDFLLDKISELMFPLVDVSISSGNQHQNNQNQNHMAGTGSSFASSTLPGPPFGCWRLPRSPRPHVASSPPPRRTEGGTQTPTCPGSDSGPGRQPGSCAPRGAPCSPPPSCR